VILAYAGIGALLFLLLTSRHRRDIRAGELQAWWDAGYQAAVSDALRLVRESERIDVRWEAGPWELKELQ
jgi:hypothetical protein